MQMFADYQNTMWLGLGSLCNIGLTVLGALGAPENHLDWKVVLGEQNSFQTGWLIMAEWRVCSSMKWVSIGLDDWFI